MNKKGIRRLVLSLLFILTLTTQCVFAHSGRTDSSGGHKDNKNKSGLGYYHYLYIIMEYVLILIINLQAILHQVVHSPIVLTIM